MVQLRVSTLVRRTEVNSVSRYRIAPGTARLDCKQPRILVSTTVTASVPLHCFILNFSARIKLEVDEHPPARASLSVVVQSTALPWVVPLLSGVLEGDDLGPCAQR